MTHAGSDTHRTELRTDGASATVVLYGRSGCCLCDQAREVILRVQRRVPFALQERDIESDERLLRAYLERIPVVMIDGREAFELQVDEAALERLLTDSQAAHRPL